MLPAGHWQSNALEQALAGTSTAIKGAQDAIAQLGLASTGKLYYNLVGTSAKKGYTISTNNSCLKNDWYMEGYIQVQHVESSC